MRLRFLTIVVGLSLAPVVTLAAERGQRGEAKMKHNAAGAVTTENLADGAAQSHDYYNTGSGKAFKDPGTTPETTSVTTDNLGRPLVITYEADGTTQEIHYEGSRVLAVKDRQDRWQSFFYENGHLSEIWDGQTPRSGNKLDKIEYDGAGRVIHWTTPDAKIDYANFTLDGLPQSTTQTRFKNHSGFTGATQLDQFTQTHGYNGHGERISYSVPGGGAPGFATSVTVHYDAMGNIDSLTTDGGLTLTGDYRAAGRSNSRTITLGAKSLERKYTYKDGTGQLQEMRAAILAGGVRTDVAGSTVAYDGLLVNDAALIGVSGGARHTSHSYDKRGRLRGSIVGANAAGMAPPPDAAATTPGSTAEVPDPANFRTGQSRAPLLDPAVSSLLQSRGVDTSKIDPPPQTSIPAAGHKIGTFTRGASTRIFDFANKSELLDDGLFRYHYDQKGRLDWAAEKATATGVTIRRILYTYDGNNRLVGRTAQAATVTSLTASYDTFTWNLEIRPEVIAAEGIPAETTFVWDSVSDRIIAVVRTGDSAVQNDPNNNTLKQIIHGDMGYDDPLEVTTVDTSVVVAPGQAQPVTKLYPIYDEAAGGTLQVVLNKNLEVVARSINNDPFGGAEFDLAGAAIDHVEVQATKNAQGGLTSVAITMRATEQLTAASIASGTRLAVVDSNGTVVRTSTTQPTLSDPFTVKWTLPAAEWTALSAPAAVGGRTPVSLSIAVTNTLRAALWKFDLPVLPVPDWATASKSVFTSSTLPVEVRESLASISSTISALNAGESKTAISYDVPNLGLVGAAGNADVENLLAATFQAQPFAEPFTRKFYVRERWYDPTTGAWLTGDPIGYKDSANLYAFCGGDPVNCSDPTGLAGKSTDGGILSGVWSAVKGRAEGAGRCLGLFEHYAWYQVTGDRQSAGPAAAYKWDCVYPLERAFYAGPVETIGGGAERHRVGIVEASRSGNRAETARRSTNAVIDFLSLAAAFDAGATAGPTEGPSLALADARGAVPTATLTTPSPAIVPNIVFATSLKKRTKAGAPTTQDSEGNWHDQRGRFTRFRYPGKTRLRQGRSGDIDTRRSNRPLWSRGRNLRFSARRSVP
jgi:RHS repeat-associated protein